MVLHNAGEQPEIHPLGKIAGIKEITVEKSYLNNGEKPFWQQVFDGPILIHVIRFIIDLLTAVAASVIIALISTPFIAYFSKKRRIKNVVRFKWKLNREFSKAEEMVVQYYTEQDKKSLRLFYGIIANHERLQKVISPKSDTKRSLPSEFSLRKLVIDLIEAGAIQPNKIGVTRAEEIKSFTMGFLKFLEE